MLGRLFREWCILLRLIQEFMHPSLARLSFSVDVNRFNFWHLFLPRLWQHVLLIRVLWQWFFGANNLRLHHLKRFRILPRILHRVVQRFNLNLCIICVVGGEIIKLSRVYPLALFFAFWQGPLARLGRNMWANHTIYLEDTAADQIIELRWCVRTFSVAGQTLSDKG